MVHKNLIQKFLAPVFLGLFFVYFASASENLKNLSNHYIWLKLLHFKNGQSEIDSPEFFLSDKGKYDPEEELKATIRAFKSKKYLCKFPARYFFLKNFSHIELPEFPYCPELEKFLNYIQPYKLSVVFADGYIKNPASMYGHTFLKIDPKTKSRLLGYVVNYAALANPIEGIKYYIKGLLGFYKGYFSVFPYYKKIFEYNNLEDRDLWEIELKADKENIKLLSLHIWELKNQYAYYYFFSKNCSYQILHLIDLVFYNLNSVNHFNLWVIPTDTLKFLNEKGIINSIYYRPSIKKRIKEFIKFYKIKDEYIEIAKHLAKFEKHADSLLKNRTISISDKAKILELTKLLFIYYSIKDKIPEKEYKRKYLEILKVRSRVKGSLSYKISRPSSPIKSHDPSKFSIGYGLEEKESFISLKYRFAYHSIIDIPDGYKFGSEVLFPYIEIRYLKDRKKFVLEEFNIISIRSFSPWDKIFSDISWQLHNGFLRDWTKSGKKSFFQISGGTGYSLGSKYLLFYAGMKTKFQIGVSHLHYSRLGVGGNVTFLSKFKNNIFMVDIFPYFYLSKDTGFAYSLSFRDNFAVKKNLSVSAKVLLGKIENNHYIEYKFSFNTYF